MIGFHFITKDRYDRNVQTTSDMSSIRKKVDISAAISKVKYEHCAGSRNLRLRNKNFIAEKKIVISERVIRGNNVKVLPSHACNNLN